MDWPLSNRLSLSALSVFSLSISPLSLSLAQPARRSSIPELVAIAEKDEREHHDAKAEHRAVAAGRGRANHERLVLRDRVIGGEAIDRGQVGRGHVSEKQHGDCGWVRWPMRQRCESGIRVSETVM